MARSMTGFARRETRGDFGVLVWEVRSVNHRYLDMSLRLPEELRGLEGECRERVAAEVKRGKLDGQLRFEPASRETALHVDEARARAVGQAATKVAGFLGTHAPVSPLDVLRWPGVVEEPALDVAAVGTAALKLLKDTLADHAAARGREGERTAAVLRDRAERIGAIVGSLRGKQAAMLDQLRDKLRARVDELKVQVDPQRLEQELVILAQRLDVAEELDRLGSHLKEFDDTLKGSEAVGRRLDFLMQEFNREANTLGSKSQDAVITQQVVDLKVLIEQM
ncbi:MAG TPA: YicC/YloC family endoribonuclease, partial [Gammaproteobacteria bacterium]|nr:YicC/YloC family endoribonuclease [Gammaproteobacteria bacterium]